ncbi:MAG: methylmalonyl Co-A mutase-associated GTPase MeaB [Anaerolineae bacterium]|nr:methylmalonyl Co-A mutase-associated GTPase MeaB [Anaerolineae bacterium]MDW8099621.1 methylmalonyl Co-A mutase-associated GTPase MeaB [Anaerolineae bacterium]
MDVVDRLLQGDRRTLARVISQVENGDPQARELLRRLYCHTGRAHVVGITGAPGSGKSTLVNALAQEYRGRGITVGIVAVDPTSPFTGGALLGDRVRMRELAGDPGVFIRSMASRGHLGGLARATTEVVLVLDAAGFQRILVETVGVGQAEIDVARAAHTTVIVQTPGMGDDVQTMKAGVLEIADILVINKADQNGTERAEAALRMMLDLNEKISHRGQRQSTPERQEPSLSWIPPIIRTISTRREGIVALINAIEQHATYLHESGYWHEREHLRAAFNLQELLREELMTRLAVQLPPKLMEIQLQQIIARAVDPYSAVNALLAAVGSLAVTEVRE